MPTRRQCLALGAASLVAVPAFGATPALPIESPDAFLAALGDFLRP